jgi:phosphoribosylanthranilate isomerase
MNQAEARLAIYAGASALGLVAHMPSGPGPIPDQIIAEIAAGVPPPIATFLLTSRQSVREIVAHHQRVRTTAIQIVDDLLTGTYEELRSQLPGIKLVKVIHVVGPEAIDQAIALARRVDAFLLDSGRPELALKELGGTGRRHDWSISRRIRESVEIPVFLAGGLQQDNVGEAIEDVGPFGLDVCTGVRSDGCLDPEKLTAFMSAVGSSGGS